DGVAEIAVMRGLLRLQLNTDPDGELGSHVTTVCRVESGARAPSDAKSRPYRRFGAMDADSLPVEHPAEQVDQRARLVALNRVARIVHDVGLTEMLCAPAEFGCILVGDEAR